MASIYILLAIFLWSSLGILVRMSGVSVHVLIFYSMAVSVIVQGIILIQKRYRKVVPEFRMLKVPAVLGLFSLVNTFTYFYAFQNTTIANAVLTHYIAPVIVAFLAAAFLKETITKRIIFSLIIASGGLMIMLNGFSIKEGHLAGIMAGLLSGFAYAIIIIFIRIHAKNFDPLILAFFTNTSILLFLAPFIREFPLNALWSYLFIGVVHSTIAPILYYKGLQKVTANRTAIIGYLEPVCAVILGVIFFKEEPNINSILGGALIILSGYLTISEKIAGN